MCVKGRRVGVFQWKCEATWGETGTPIPCGETFGYTQDLLRHLEEKHNLGRDKLQFMGGGHEVFQKEKEE